MAKGYKTGGRRAGSLNKWTLGRPYREAHGIVEPPRQKRRKTGGRKAGTPNRKTVRRAELRAEIYAGRQAPPAEVYAGKQAAPRAADLINNQDNQADEKPRDVEPWDRHKQAHVVRAHYEGSRQQPQVAPAPAASAPASAPAPTHIACDNCAFWKPAAAASTRCSYCGSLPGARRRRRPRSGFHWPMTSTPHTGDA
jgi:hypothetical protein